MASRLPSRPAMAPVKINPCFVGPRQRATRRVHCRVDGIGFCRRGQRRHRRRVQSKVASSPGGSGSCRRRRLRRRRQWQRRRTRGKEHRPRCTDPSVRSRSLRQRPGSGLSASAACAAASSARVFVRRRRRALAGSDRRAPAGRRRRRRRRPVMTAGAPRACAASPVLVPQAPREGFPGGSRSWKAQHSLRTAQQAPFTLGTSRRPDGSFLARPSEGPREERRGISRQCDEAPTRT